MDVLVAWERELAAGGWVGIGVPERDGGRGAGLLAEVAFHEEYAYSGAPGRLPTIGESLLAPTLIAHGSDELRARFLPGILAVRDLWCQGYSEPDAGSDLAAIKTTGRVVGDEWSITGQKIWTTWAQMADWCFVLARTEPESRGHRGLSFLLVPMDQPGIEVRPIIQLSGGEEFCEIFFSDARTERDLVVGAAGDGWNVAMSTLGYERGIGSLGMQLAFERDLDAIIDLARANGAVDDPVVRDRITRAWVGLRVLRVSVVRTLVGSQRDANRDRLDRQAGVVHLVPRHGRAVDVRAGRARAVRDPDEAPTTWPCSTGYDPDRGGTCVHVRARWSRSTPGRARSSARSSGSRSSDCRGSRGPDQSQTTGTAVGIRNVKPVTWGAGSSGSKRTPGQPIEHRFERSLHLHAGEVDADAEVRAAAEGHVRLGRPSDVEAIGFFPPRGVVVRGADGRVHEAPGRDRDTAELGVTSGHARHRRQRLLPTEAFLDRGLQQPAIVAEHGELLGVAQQPDQQRAETAVGRAGTRREEQAREREHLVVGEPVAVAVVVDDFGGAHERDQVVGGFDTS